MKGNSEMNKSDFCTLSLFSVHLFNKRNSEIIKDSPPACKHAQHREFCSIPPNIGISFGRVIVVYCLDFILVAVWAWSFTNNAKTLLEISHVPGCLPHPCSGWCSMCPWAFACCWANMRKEKETDCFTPCYFYFLLVNRCFVLLSVSPCKSSSYSEYLIYSPY